MVLVPEAGYSLPIWIKLISRGNSCIREKSANIKKPNIVDTRQNSICLFPYFPPQGLNIYEESAHKNVVAMKLNIDAWKE